jgi:hypothetical protein
VRIDNLTTTTGIISLFTIIYFVYLLLKYNINKIRKNLLNEKIIMEKVLNYYNEDQAIINELIEKYPE